MTISIVAEAHIGDTVQFELTIKDQDGNVVNISTASTIQIIFKDPSGTVLTKTATLVDGGVYGKMQYTTLPTDLNQSGEWTYQGFVIIGTGQWHTDEAIIPVRSNLV